MIRRSARRPFLDGLTAAVGAGLDAVKGHARDGLDLVHLAGREDDGGPGAKTNLPPAVVEEAFAVEDIVDLVGIRMRMDGRDLPGSQPTMLMALCGVSARLL